MTPGLLTKLRKLSSSAQLSPCDVQYGTTALKNYYIHSEKKEMRGIITRVILIIRQRLAGS